MKHKTLQFIFYLAIEFHIHIGNLWLYSPALIIIRIPHSPFSFTRNYKKLSPGWKMLSPILLEGGETLWEILWDNFNLQMCPGKFSAQHQIYNNKALKHAVFYSKNYFKIIKSSSDKKGMVEGHGVQVL